MPPVLLDLKRTEDTRDAIHHAVEALAAGRILAIPTETVYGLAASALCPAAVQRLYEIKGTHAIPLAFAVKSADDALDYAPDLSPLARRLARRCWPGPLTLVVPGPHRDSVVQRLNESVRQATVGQGTLGLRVPAHDLAIQIFRLNAGPIVLTSAAVNGEKEATAGAQVVKIFGDRIDLVLDDGPCRFAQPSTVVKVENETMTVLRKGVLDDQVLRRMSETTILLVCTGNTCRSPMAEGLFKKRLAERYGCRVEELHDRGINVISAGVSAMAGGNASPQAIEILAKHEVDISQHCSQPVTDRLIQDADLILTMTWGHRQAVISQWPTAAKRTFTLGGERGEIPDPIGMPAEHYEYCARQIDDYVQWWLDNYPMFKGKT